jgi:hypothetical protein
MAFCVCVAAFVGCSSKPQPASSLATIAPPQQARIETATKIQNAKSLYETGKYDEAETILSGVLMTDPSNKAAAFYLDLDKKARLARHRYDLLPIPNATDRSGIRPTSMGRQDILSKLGGIRLTEVSYDLPLTEVLNRLRIESQKRDPNGVGVNFMFRGDMTGIVIIIDPALHDLRLIDLLAAITKFANRPIIFTIEDYGVVFSPRKS